MSGFDLVALEHLYTAAEDVDNANSANESVDHRLLLHREITENTSHDADLEDQVGEQRHYFFESRQSLTDKQGSRKATIPVAERSQARRSDAALQAFVESENSNKAKKEAPDVEWLSDLLEDWSLDELARDVDELRRG